MKTLRTALLVTAVALLSFGSARAQIGFLGGLNWDSFSEVKLQNDVSSTVESAQGFHVGLFYEFGLGPLNIRPAVLYRKSGDVKLEEVDVPAFDLNVIEIPVDLTFGFLGPAYVSAGPVFNFQTSNDQEADESLSSLAMSANVGLGVKIGLLGLSVAPEFRYAFGLSSMLNDTIDVNGVSVDVADAPKASTIQLRIHLAL